uniref:Uncharacterized protein n=1 Tax=Rhizophora mucronata TaxID=61149 RepID=A0A2P2P9L8_RHIMU
MWMLCVFYYSKKIKKKDTDHKYMII